MALSIDEATRQARASTAAATPKSPRARTLGSAATLGPSLLGLLEAAPGLVVMAATIDGEVLYLNAEGHSLLGVDPSRARTSLRLREFYTTRSQRLLAEEIIPACLRRGAWRGETTLLGQDQRRIPATQIFVAHRIPQQGGDLTVLASIAWDLRRQKFAERLLWRQATHDALTDCPNRALLMDRLAQALHRAERNGRMLGVLFLDLDDFKQINDTFGHEPASGILRELSRRLRTHLRADDTVARYGGDEFVILMPDLGTAHDVERVTRKVGDILREPFVVGNARIRVAASVGVALYPRDGEDPDSLLRAADAEMYSAKKRAKSNNGAQSPAWSFPPLPSSAAFSVEQRSTAAGLMPS